MIGNRAKNGAHVRALARGAAKHLRKSALSTPASEERIGVSVRHAVDAASSFA